MPSRSEWDQRQATRAHQPERRATLEAERRAQTFVSIRMDDLLASDDWTIFRKHLEVIRAQYDALMASATERILGDALGDELMKLKLERAGWDGLVKGIDLALLMPEHLKAQAARVEATLAGQLDSPADRR
jgi:hypothetical protein